MSGSVAGLPDHEDHDHDDDRPEQGSVHGGVAPLTVVRVRRATLAGRFVLVAGVGPGDEAAMIDRKIRYRPMAIQSHWWSKNP